MNSQDQEIDQAPAAPHSAGVRGTRSVAETNLDKVATAISTIAPSINASGGRAL
tara:strand:+ start:1206 stop:1367 length:162 start_codon:yes stop_codon:yes gene_type:complete